MKVILTKEEIDTLLSAMRFCIDAPFDPRIDAPVPTSIRESGKRWYPILLDNNGILFLTNLDLHDLKGPLRSKYILTKDETCKTLLLKLIDVCPIIILEQKEDECRAFCEHTDDLSENSQGYLGICDTCAKDIEPLMYKYHFTLMED